MEVLSRSDTKTDFRHDDMHQEGGEVIGAGDEGGRVWMGEEWMYGYESGTIL